MKRVMLLMVLAALLLTQCRKPSVKFPSAEVSMTVTAGPSSKTDISTTGGIVWSTGDKIYVGCNGKYVGCLSIVSGVGSKTGTFNGTVTGVSDGTKEFHFFYLGSGSPQISDDGGTATVSFASQDIYAEGGKLKNANRQHVGYGTASGDVDGGAVVGVLNVEMKSKVAIAYFHFEREATSTPYKGALTLSGDHIYSSMTVGFGGTFSPGTKGSIRLARGHAQRYVMLVPPTNATEERKETLNFGGGATGCTTLENGIEANKFYRVDGSMPIVVKVTTVISKFSVDGDGTMVEFSPGNLQYIGSAPVPYWKFADHQYDYIGGETGSGQGTDAVDVDRDLFGWGATGYQDTRSDAHAHQTNYQPYSTSTAPVSGGSGINDYGYGPDYYSDSKYDLTVEDKSDWGCLEIGTDPAGTWRTLTRLEWWYLLSQRSGSLAPEIGDNTDCRYALVYVNGVKGMMIFPDVFEWPSAMEEDVPTTFNGCDTKWNNVNYLDSDFEKLEQAGVVFLPAAGYRDETGSYVGSHGSYWSCSCYDSSIAYNMLFRAANVYPQLYSYERCSGCSVRLVR